MAEESGTPPPPLQKPPKKKGCGCFLSGCLGFFLILALIFAGLGVATYYALQNADVADKAVLWTYKNVARPKIVELLPPHMPEAQKARTLKLADQAVQNYIELPADEKAILLKEATIASWYYSQDKVVPPNEIPNLTKFIEANLQEGMKLPPKPKFPPPPPPGFP